jgi:hypothetical protein
MDNDKLQTAATAALCVLAEFNIPPDIQELLVFGNSQGGVPPGALSKAVQAVWLTFLEPHAL